MGSSEYIVKNEPTSVTEQCNAKLVTQDRKGGGYNSLFELTIHDPFARWLLKTTLPKAFEGFTYEPSN